MLGPPKVGGIQMLHVFVLAACILTALAMFRPGTAQADGVGVGWLHAMSYQRVPVEQPAMIVKTYDDGALDVLIRDHMIEALREVDCNVNAPDSSFELELGSQIRSVDYKGRDPNMGRFSLGGLNSFKIQSNVWSTSQDSILGGRKNGARRQGANEFEIEATLRDRRTGVILWRGRAIAPQEGSRLEAMVPNMVEALAANVGRTVRGVPFSLLEDRASRTRLSPTSNSIR